jgi:signal peptidase I
MDQAVALNSVPRSFAMPTFGMEPTILRAELFYALEEYYRSTEPKRGDVVLYKVPQQGLSYVRRVVALPGETVQLVRGLPQINGIPAERERVGIFVESGGRKSLARFRERIKAAPAYEIVADAEMPRLTRMDPIVLDAGTYFVLGDNREELPDAAVAELGLVPRINIVDRPEVIWLSKDLSRIGRAIQPR